MSKIFSSWSLGPGLTSQIGPFKTNKRDYPKLQKTPWKGGGVAGGGQGHAGNGNYYSCMTPAAFPMQFPQPVNYPSKYASIVTVHDIYKPTAKRGPPGSFSKAAQATGQPAPVGTQKMALGSGGSHRVDAGVQDNDAGIYHDAREEPEVEPYNELDAAMQPYPSPQPTPMQIDDDTPPMTPVLVRPTQNAPMNLAPPPKVTRDFNTQTMVHDEASWAGKLENLVMSLSEENEALANKAKQAGAEASEYTAASLNERQQKMMRAILSHFGVQTMPDVIDPNEFQAMVTGLADVTPMLIQEREGLENFARGMRDYTENEERQFKEYQDLKAQQAGIKSSGSRKRHRAGYYDDVSGRARLTGQDASTSTNEANQADAIAQDVRKLQRTGGTFGEGRVQRINTQFTRFANNEPRQKPAHMFKPMDDRIPMPRNKRGGITGRV